MCLYTKQICPIKARKDIVCYKVFVISNTCHTCITPTVNRIIPDPRYTIKPFLMDDSNKSICRQAIYSGVYGFKVTGISQGMIHAYQDVERARRAMERFPLWAPLEIYECIIPKGTLYFKGLDGDICSKKLLIVKRVVD